MLTITLSQLLKETGLASWLARMANLERRRKKGFGFCSEFEGDDGGDFIEFIETFEDEPAPDYWLPGDVLEAGGWE